MHVNSWNKEGLAQCRWFSCFKDHFCYYQASSFYSSCFGNFWKERQGWCNDNPRNGVSRRLLKSCFKRVSENIWTSSFICPKLLFKWAKLFIAQFLQQYSRASGSCTEHSCSSVCSICTRMIGCSVWQMVQLELIHPFGKHLWLQYYRT